ncbi:hypothetical protein Cni_G01975 [Canna indica]|uniref:Uncharacterized protein n=1 Tax=Canna indica TaxID=4628 RepID=A0AAQ3Q1P4_9LILI|nr:hypothetical protein Cni_G01975 [Canna indica]
MAEIAAVARASGLGKLLLVHGEGDQKAPIKSGSRFAAANLTSSIWKSQRKKEITNNLRLHYHPPPPPRGSRILAAVPAASSSEDIISFDEYIFDRPRVFRAMFPDIRRSKQLNDEEWRIQMLPIKFLFASVNPVVVMRLRHKSNGKEYPPGVPEHATGVLELQATRWELQGLEEIQMPPHFALNVQGVLYADRSSKNRRLKGHLEMRISLILPPALTLVPDGLLRSIADAVLRRLLEKMKHEVDVGLISDFGNFRREKLMKLGAAAAAAAISSELRNS